LHSLRYEFFAGSTGSLLLPERDIVGRASNNTFLPAQV
jgi:hypothetical protein